MISQGIPRAKPKSPRVDFKFSMLPDPVSRRNDISPGCKVMFGLILSICRTTGQGCKLTNGRLAERTGLCVKQVKRNLDVLERSGLIRRVLQGRGRLAIVATWDQMSPPVCTGGDIESGDMDPMSPPDGTRCPHMENGGINLRLYASSSDGEDGEDDGDLPPEEVARRIRAMLGR